ncbi:MULTISPECIES: phosphoribosyl-ATP diphosphatase [Acetobacter]|uniref:Phosphoribosyl-ATP pyrophosphatase n=1 Tax=Acetobacter thailandicus TaxID=1502842 RepID=A0ABT3QE43_9PROT|nr:MULTISPECIES: phosphoribosyl-ATP diphosphatase [Acetobacter]MBS0961149.1 phosphoribosyl-ATP diphosphatase [Acetobacter thailandicus]MBS0980225.1 phosphoribosyl-ATP diphosphatase [Acetobacter thailandicus]MBS0986548.1 phosphoribosyl-ATP diphosphatase [Acetobacter thailandicus]MBS1004103.1 phosphoribosyl-ATP diphosphatase [Acetobacter thailandicus]MCX2563559.1 phosphoribosyl-ATP diphosphatase [Acetobacter thailandicus]
MIKKVSTKTPPVTQQDKKAAATSPAKKKVTAKPKAVPTVTAEQLADVHILERLFTLVESRKGTDPSLSHSARLLSRGTSKIAQKFGEEAVECLIEAVAGRKDELISESADVLYHLIVMLVDSGVQLNDIWAELHRREGISGIAEKASRPKKNLSKKG